MFTAGLILTIMVVPIIASISRDLFLTRPAASCRTAPLALGATRWEMVRGVVLPSTASGRRRRRRPRPRPRARRGDRGHAGDRRRHASITRIAVRDRRHAREPDRRRSSRARRPSCTSPRCSTSRVILLVIGLVANLLAQWIVAPLRRRRHASPHDGRRRSTRRRRSSPSGNLRRRRRRQPARRGRGDRGRAARRRACSAIVVCSRRQRGGGALSLDFLTKDPPLFGGAGRRDRAGDRRHRA